MGCGASAGRFEEFSSFYAQYSLGTTPKALGKGSYGSVFLANAKHSKSSTYAVKVQTSRRTATKKIEHEAKIWKLCASHRNVVHFVQMCQEADIYFMIMEACQCSLFDRLIDNPKWVWDQLAGDLHQLIAGLQHLHSRRVLHSDIKAENALYGGQDGRTLKLADFGLAVYITPSEGPLTRAGSRSYMAPEMLAGEGYAFPADMWSFGVLVYVILVGQFPIGQSKQTKSELTRNIIKVDKEPARVTNLANKLKRAIAAEQGKLDRKPHTSLTSESHRSSSEFHRVLPSSEGSQAPEEVITRHVSIQMKRLKVVEFIRLFLQRDPQERCNANEAIQSELFQELQHMKQEHRAMENESQLLIINRRPLKRSEPAPGDPGDALPQKPEEEPGKVEDEGIKVTGTTTKGPTGGATTGAPPPVTTAKSLPSPMVTSPIRAVQPPGDSPDSPKAPPKKSLTSGRLQVEEDVDESRGKAEPLRRRSFTSQSLADNSQGMSLLQVPQRRRKSQSSKQDDAPPSRSGSDYQSHMLLEAHEKDLRPSSEGQGQDNSVVALTPPGKDDSNRVTNGAGSSSRRPEAPASPEPEADRDGDPAELTERGQLTKTFSRMSSRGSRLGMRSMLSRDNSGFDLLHNLANTNVRGDSSWQLEQSGIDASTLRQSRSRGGLSSAASMRSGVSVSVGRVQETDELSPLQPHPPDPWRGDAANSEQKGKHKSTPRRQPSSSSNNDFMDDEGPRPSALQRRVSLGDMGGESPNPKNLRRRVSFDEVLVMQHMLPLVPNMVPKEEKEEKEEKDGLSEDSD